MMAILVQSDDPGRKEAPPRLREDLRQRYQRATAADEFRETRDALGLTQHRVAQLFGVGPRSIRRWQRGDRRIPRGVGIVLRLLAAGVVTISQIEQAAVPIPARTNGGPKPESLAPLPVAPAPEQPTLARAEATTLAAPGLTTAEKVLALTPEACRWPCGDPGCPDFHFCGSPVAKRPYCEHHRAMAYMAAPARAARGKPVTWQRLTLPSRSLPARQDHIR